MERRKCAIVTGGARGIGRGIVTRLAKAGYDVAFSYNAGCEEALRVVRIVEERYGVRAYCIQAKLDQPGEGKRFFDEATKFLGSLDLLVNNAGVTIFENLLDIKEETIDYLFALDFRNYVIMMREAAKYMIAHQVKGSIVNITSSRGEQAYPNDGIYGGVKAGLNRVVESFALDVAKYGIRINNVAPGATTRCEDELEEMKNAGNMHFFAWEDRLGPQIPLGRLGTPNDVSDAILFLASEQASYITGVTLRVDGGLILPGMPEDKDIGWN